MKRSFCLSALLVGGLSLTTATAALAAPPAGSDEQPVKQVAQVQLLAQQSDGTSTGPSNAPAPSDGSSTPSQPAVSIGTSTTAPASDTPAESAPAPAKAPAPRPFAGSAIYTRTSMATGTVFRGQQQDYNPTVETDVWFLPRYAINDAFQLRARVLMNYEWTNSDSTTYRNEPVLSDTTFQLFYRKIPKLPLGVIPMLSLNAGLPTSKLSRSRTMVVSPGATLQLVKPLEPMLKSDGGIILGSLIYTHPFYSSQNAQVVDPRPANSFSCVGGNGCSDLLSGVMNPSNILSYALLVEMEWGHFAPAIYYLGASQWTYSPREVNNPVDGTPITSATGQGPVAVRQTHYFSAWLDYNFNSWITGEVGVWNATNAISGGGQRTNPFWNQYGDTRVYLGASIQLDNLVKTLQGGDEGEAGVVRAKNQKQPMWTF